MTQLLGAGHPPLDPIAPTAARPVRRARLLQHWNDITWLHWPYPPELVQVLLPSALRVDTFEGRAWVGLVPFRMTSLRPPGLPPLPWLSTFAEINVRTYVVTPDGRRAVWFFSLEVPRSAAVVVARLGFGLPYCWADATIERAGDRISYQSTRRWPADGTRTRIDVEAGASVAPDATIDLEHFLTARFGLATQRRGRLLHGAVDHPAWPLRRGRLLDLDDHLVTAAGLPAPYGEPLVHVADGVPVRVGRLEPLDLVTSIHHSPRTPRRTA